MLVVGTTIVVPELEGAQLMFQISQNWEVPNLALLCPRTGRRPTHQNWEVPNSAFKMSQNTKSHN